MIRVLHLLGSAHAGGVETFVQSLAQEIDRRRFSITVCILDHEGPVAARLRALQVPVTTVGKGLPALARFMVFLLANRFDVLHANTGGRLYRRAALLAGLRRIIVHVHGPSQEWGSSTGTPNESFRQRVTASTSVATRVIVCARWLARVFVDAGIDRFRPMNVVQYGIVAPKFVDPGAMRTAQDIARDSVVIGFIGRLTEQKGVDELAAAISRIAPQRRDVVFLIVGDGTLMPVLRKLQSTVGSHRLILTGAVEDAAALLPAMDIVAMPSRWEGLSIAHIEAMFAAKPVVGFAIDGLTEAAEPGVTGLYVPLGDGDAFAAALVELIDDSVRRSAMGEAAARKAAAEFRADRMTREIEHIYSMLSVAGS